MNILAKTMYVNKVFYVYQWCVLCIHASNVASFFF